VLGIENGSFCTGFVLQSIKFVSLRYKIEPHRYKIEPRRYKIELQRYKTEPQKYKTEPRRYKTDVILSFEWDKNEVLYPPVYQKYSGNRSWLFHALASAGEIFSL
jgi:hypothetical protein